MNVVLVIGCCWFKVRRVCVLFRILLSGVFFGKSSDM
jgi:hypothetical protein